MHDSAAISARRRASDAALPAARRILVILNPAAGQRRRGLVEATLTALRDSGCDLTLKATGGPGHATNLANAACSGAYDVVVAAGGDGTVNEVINGLLAAEGAVPLPPLAILPLGTANVLAAEIGQRIAPAAIAATVARGAARSICLGRASFKDDGGPRERVFVMMAGAGFDAHVVEQVNLGLKRLIGKGAYVWGSARQLFAFGFPRYRVTLDGTTHETASVILANGRHYGGRYVVAPDADLADPWLYALLFERGGRRATLRYGQALVAGRLPRLPDVRLIAAREIVIEGPPGDPVQGDGDLLARLPVRISAVPDALRLVLPPT
jgi:YegS/Rv2252/BmrU family lipid kinase